MAVALKNCPETENNQLARLAPLFDFAINEECHSYNECGGYKTHFIDKGKAYVDYFDKKRC
jgi:hypothetical protein